MKKLTLVLLVLCVIALSIVGSIALKKSADPPTEPVDNEQTEIETDGPEEPLTAAEAEIPVDSGLEYAAIYALHDPEEKVLEIGGREECWGDYFYALYSQCRQIEKYFGRAAMFYGRFYGWNDPIEAGGEETFAQLAAETAEKQLIQIVSLEVFAEENGIALQDEDLVKVEEKKQDDLVSAVGEDGTADEFRDYLSSIYLTEEMHDRIAREQVLYEACFNRLYGEKGDKLSEDEVFRFLEDNGYYSIAHILLMTVDPDTGKELDEAVLAEKWSRLEDVLKELRSIDDQQERVDAFFDMVRDVSEETGREKYPEGYTYKEGKMVPLLENTVRALEEYGISDVVEASYGYHIFMRLPLRTDAVVGFNTGTGEPRTTRMLVAEEEFGERLQATADALSLRWLPGYAAPDLTGYISK